MKILIVNKFLYPVGGAETYMFKLGEYLSSKGIEIQYFGMEDERNIVGNDKGVYVKKIDFKSAKITDKIFYPFKLIYSFEARNKIASVLDDFKPDIVHMNNINFQLTPSIIYEIRRRKIPIVQTVHDPQISCPNHRLYNENEERICDKCLNGKYINCFKEKCLKNSRMASGIATIESYYYHKRNTYNLIDKYICPSEFISEIIKAGGIEEPRIEVLYNFSDNIEEVSLDNLKKDYVLYFGRLSTEKGIKTLLSACEKLTNINFVIAGDGPLKKDINKLSNVKFLGFKSGDELNKLIKEARFSVYPSEWYENCPLSVIESKNLGTPVIVSDLGGAKELIKDGVTGLVFKGGEKQQLINSIERLWNNKELCNNMSKNCIKNRNNTIDIYFNNIIEIYNKIIRNN